MKTLSLFLSLLLSLPTFGAEFLPGEEDRLVELVKNIGIAYERRDADKIVEMTIEPIVAAAGGSEAMKIKTRQALEQLHSAGIVIESTSIGRPTAPLSVGRYILSFVPKVTEMRMPGKRGRSISFLVAAREVQSAEWRFMDGAGLRKNPLVLRLLFPELPENLALPENRLELLP
jgi:hypothetical protein